jgi:hypothetical protein
LEWCSLSNNNRNISSKRNFKYEYIDEISDDATEVRYYDVG